MSPTFILKEPIGGLGNQFFQVAGLLSICKDLSANYVLPTHISSAWGTVASPVYWNSIFSKVTQSSSELKETHTHYYDMVSSGEQFVVRDFTVHKNTNDIVLLNGLLMNKNHFLHNLSYVKDFFKPFPFENYTLNDDKYINVCIGIRRFVWEKTEHYAYPEEYFELAIDRFFEEYSKKPNEKILRLAFFTDDSKWTSEFVNKYFQKKNIHNEFIIFQGARDGSTEVKHFYEMFFCKHFIFSDSTFHYWAAMLTCSKDSIVIHSGRSAWQQHILLPEWIQVD